MDAVRNRRMGSAGRPMSIGFPGKRGVAPECQGATLERTSEGSDARSRRMAATSPFDRLSEARRNLLGHSLRRLTLREDSARREGRGEGATLIAPPSPICVMHSAPPSWQPSRVEASCGARRCQPLPCSVTAAFRVSLPGSKAGPARATRASKVAATICAGDMTKSSGGPNAGEG